MLGNMDSTTKDELKIREYNQELKNMQQERKCHKMEITNYDEMLKELIISIDETCEAILLNLKSESYILAAYNIGMLHKEASDAIDQFGIGHLFTDEAQKND